MNRNDFPGLDDDFENDELSPFEDDTELLPPDAAAATGRPPRNTTFLIIAALLVLLFIGALVGIAALVIANNDAVVKAKQTADAIYATNTAVQIAINATETAKSWTKTPTPTNTPTDTPTPTATNTPTNTITPSPTITPNFAATTQSAQQTQAAMSAGEQTSVAQTQAAQNAVIQAGQAQISIARTALAPNQPQQTIAAFGANPAAPGAAEAAGQAYATLRAQADAAQTALAAPPFQTALALVKTMTPPPPPAVLTAFANAQLALTALAGGAIGGAPAQPAQPAQPTQPAAQPEQPTPTPPAPPVTATPQGTTALGMGSSNQMGVRPAIGQLMLAQTAIAQNESPTPAAATPLPDIGATQTVAAGISAAQTALFEGTVEPPSPTPGAGQNTFTPDELTQTAVAMQQTNTAATLTAIGPTATIFVEGTPGATRQVTGTQKVPDTGLFGPSADGKATPGDLAIVVVAALGLVGVIFAARRLRVKS